MSSLANRRVGNCDETLTRDLSKLEIIVNDEDVDDQDEIDENCLLSVAQRSGAETAPAYGIISDSECALKR